MLFFNYVSQLGTHCRKLCVLYAVVHVFTVHQRYNLILTLENNEVLYFQYLTKNMSEDYILLAFRIMSWEVYTVFGESRHIMVQYVSTQYTFSIIMVLYRTDSIKTWHCTMHVVLKHSSGFIA